MNQDLIQNLESEIHVWWFVLDQPQHFVDSYYRILKQDEKKRILNFKTELLRNRHTVSRGVLKILISKYLDADPEKVEFMYSEQGKPFLSSPKNKTNLQFNMSHSNRLGICAFTKDNAVGVDVERIRELPNLEDMTEICMSEFEKRWFSKLPPATKNEMFYKVWTVKEAFIKAIGAGFSFPLVNVEVKIYGNNKCEFHRIKDESGSFGKWRVFTFVPEPNFTASLVTEADNSKIKRFYWEPSFTNGKQ
jgi:4'-phosphopantetheinyl transferase